VPWPGCCTPKACQTRKLAARLASGVLRQQIGEGVCGWWQCGVASTWHHCCTLAAAPGVCPTTLGHWLGLYDVHRQVLLLTAYQH
jgi:hypothetical protein